MTKNGYNPPMLSVVLAYLVVYIVWGSTFFFIEKALHSFPPFVLGSIRFLAAGPILMFYCFLKGYKLFEKQAVLQAVFVGFLLLFVDMAAIIWSEQYISSGIVAIISAATAIWFIIFDKPKWKQNFGSAPIVIGLILGFFGVFMLFAEQIFKDDSSNKTQSLIAMAVMTFGTIGWTIGSLYSKYAQERQNKERKDGDKDLNVIVKTAWQMIVAGTAFTTVALISGQYADFQWSAVRQEDWLSMIYLIFMGSILAFSCYIWLLQARPATEVSTYAYINPIVALLLVHFFTSHIVTRLQIIGLVVVLCSVLLMNWNLYMNKRTFVKLRRRRKLKRLRTMAPKSSIPRIMELTDFASRRKNKNK